MKYGLLPEKSFENDASSSVAPRNPSNDGGLMLNDETTLSFLHHVPLGHTNEKAYEARLQELGKKRDKNWSSLFQTPHT